ncbi:LacI family transcriptional regulator [Enterobacterales bacterium CwR94]|nr:LacI family transcriptional regulator [Enterobacterales bacterium CwR94]
MKRKSFAPVTSQQVAQLAGVSQSAVSRTFTPGASISPATREKVMQAARELGYRPNALARSLNTARSRIIGVVISWFDNHFYPQVLEVLAQQLDALNYHLLLFVENRDGTVDKIFDQIMQYRVDGIVLASVSLSDALSQECQAAGIPVVLFNRAADDALTSSVNTDNCAAARQIAEFLLAGGHQRFAYVAGLPDSSVNQLRQQGFSETLAARGLTLQVVQGNYDREQTLQAARSLFNRATPPDAVFAATDHMALMVMDVARYEFGLAIPEQLSVVGYDDVGPAGWPSYALTSASQPVQAMVDATVALLMKQIDSGTLAPEQIQIPATLVVRHSARRPRVGVVESDGYSWFRPEDVK